MSEPKTASPADIRELLEACEIRAIFVWEDRARRLVRVPPESVDDNPEPDAVDDPMSISTNIAVSESALHFRFRVTFDDGLGSYVSDVETVYSVERFDPE